MKARKIILGLLCFALTILSAACSNSPSVKSLRFSISSHAENDLQLLIEPLDKNRQLINVEGELNVKLWAYNLSSESKEDLMQQWDNIPIANDSYVEDYGSFVTLEYKDFKPEQGKYYYVELILTVGDTSFTVVGFFPERG